MIVGANVVIANYIGQGKRERLKQVVQTVMLLAVAMLRSAACPTGSHAAYPSVSLSSVYLSFLSYLLIPHKSIPYFRHLPEEMQVGCIRFPKMV